MIRSFEDFDVYQRAYEISLDIHKASLGFPKIEQFDLASQIRRSTKSICANIAEGYGKSSSAAEFKRYLTIALGSANETRVHLKYCKDLGYLSKDIFVYCDNEYIEICKMLSKLISVWR